MLSGASDSTTETAGEMTFETKTLAAIVHEIYSLLYSQNEINRPLHTVWRQTLDAKTEQDFYYALAVVRTIIEKLIEEIKTQKTLSTHLVNINVNYAAQLKLTTNLDSLTHPCSKYANDFTKDRRNSILMLDHLLKGHSVHGVTPKDSLDKIATSLGQLRQQIESDQAVDPSDRQCLFQSIDKFLWIIKMIGLLGTSAGFQEAMFTYAAVRHPTMTPAGQKSETTTGYWSRVKDCGETLITLLDTVNTTVTRVKTAAMLGAGALAALSGPAM